MESHERIIRLILLKEKFRRDIVNLPIYIPKALWYYDDNIIEVTNCKFVDLNLQK